MSTEPDHVVHGVVMLAARTEEVRAAVVDPAVERVYVALGRYAWGKGPDAATAKLQLARALGVRKLRRSDAFVLLLLPVGAHSAVVDNFGHITWEGGDGSQPETVEKHQPARGRK